MANEFTKAVDQINKNGGFLSYSAYTVWRGRAVQLDSGVQMGADIGDYLTADLNAGLLHYDKGYSPLWDIFVVGKLPATGGVGTAVGGRLFGLSTTTMAIIGGGLLLLLILAKK